jgi:nucleotide-binding universal stress UspA family protein
MRDSDAVAPAVHDPPLAGRDRGPARRARWANDRRPPGRVGQLRGRFPHLVAEHPDPRRTRRIARTRHPPAVRDVSVPTACAGAVSTPRQQRPREPGPRTTAHELGRDAGDPCQSQRLPSLALLPAEGRAMVLRGARAAHDARVASAQRQIDRLAVILQRRGFNVDSIVRFGAPVPELLAAARDTDLVVGARGESGIERLLLAVSPTGSCDILRAACCSSARAPREPARHARDRTCGRAVRDRDDGRRTHAARGVRHHIGRSGRNVGSGCDPRTLMAPTATATENSVQAPSAMRSGASTPHVGSRRRRTRIAMAGPGLTLAASPHPGAAFRSGPDHAASVRAQLTSGPGRTRWSRRS